MVVHAMDPATRIEGHAERRYGEREEAQCLSDRAGLSETGKEEHEECHHQHGDLDIIVVSEGLYDEALLEQLVIKAHDISSLGDLNLVDDFRFR